MPLRVGDLLAKFVVGNPIQPRTKFGSIFIRLESGHGASHCDEHALDKLEGIGVLQATRSGDSINHRLVDSDELSPRLDIVTISQPQN